MSPTQATEKGRFGELPAEIQLEIFESLDYDAALKLAATNKHYRSVIDPQTLVPLERKIAFLKEAEFFDQHLHAEDLEKLIESRTAAPEGPFANTGPGFACVECLRIKKWYRFFGCCMRGELEKPQSLALAENYSPERLCANCAATPQVYSHGSEAGVEPICECTPEWEIWWCNICQENARKDPLKYIRRIHGCPECGLCVHMTACRHMLVCPTCRGHLVQEPYWSWEGPKNNGRRQPLRVRTEEAAEKSPEEPSEGEEEESPEETAGEEEDLANASGD